MKLPKLVIRPAAHGCEVLVQPPAHVAVERRLLMMGYTIEGSVNYDVQKHFKLIGVLNPPDRDLSVTDLVELLKVEPLWEIVNGDAASGTCPRDSSAFTSLTRSSAQIESNRQNVGP
jgi:hypothetical protein